MDNKQNQDQTEEKMMNAAAQNTGAGGTADTSERQMAGFARKLMDVEKKQYSMLQIMMIANVVLAACIVLAMLVMLPKMVSVAASADKALEEVNILAGNAQKTLENIDKTVEDANTTVNSAGKILEENAEGMEQALENINGIDFESLNQAIKDLQQSVEPLANLGRMFS